MKNILYLLILFCAFGYSQTQATKTDVIAFQGNVTSTIRDAYDVPTGEYWLIYNTTTDQLEVAGDDDVWSAFTAGGADQLGSDLDRGDATISGSGTVLTIDTGAVTGAKILDGTIEAADIASGTVTGSNIANSTITAVDIADDAVSESELNSGNSPTDEYVLSYEADTGGFEWQVGSGTDNSLSEADQTILTGVTRDVNTAGSGTVSFSDVGTELLRIGGNNDEAIYVKGMEALTGNTIVNISPIAAPSLNKGAAAASGYDKAWIEDTTDGELYYSNATSWLRFLMDGSALDDIGTPASDDKVLIQDTSGSDEIKYVDYSDISGTGISNVVEDLTPELGGNLAVGTGNNVDFTNGTETVRMNWVGDAFYINPLTGNALVYDFSEAVWKIGSEPIDNDDQTAAEVNTTDAGGYFTGTELEAITQELGEKADIIVVGDGATDMTSAVNTALTNWDEVYILGDVVTTSAITLTTDQRIYGSGKITNNTTDVIIFNGNNIHIEDINFSSTSDHIFTVTSGFNVSVKNCYISVLNTGKSAWYQRGTTGMYNLVFEGNYVETGPSHTVPMIDVVVTAENFNDNKFLHNVFQTNGSPTSHIIHFETTNASNWIYNNVVSYNTFEIPNAGVLHAYSNLGLTMVGNGVYDMGTSTADLFIVDNTSGGLDSQATVFRDYRRVGGTLGSGFVDFDNDGHYAGNISIENPSGTAAATLEFEGMSGHRFVGGAYISDYGGAILNDEVDASAFAGNLTTGDNTLQEIADAVDGLSTGGVSATGTPVDNEIAIWTDATTIEGDSRLTWNNGTLNITAGPNSMDFGGNDITFNASGGSSYISQDGAQSLIFRTENGSSTLLDRVTIEAGASPSINIDLDAVFSDDVDVSSGSVTVSDEAYSASFNGDFKAVTQNAVYDEMETRVDSDVTGVTGADVIDNFISLTQSEYDAITPDASTVYVITDAKQEHTKEVPLGAVGHDVATGTGLTFVYFDEAITITSVSASVLTAGTTSVITYDINLDDGSPASILSTKLTIDATERFSSTAATAAVISDATIPADSFLIFDCDTADSGDTGADGTIIITYTVD